MSQELFGDDVSEAYDKLRAKRLGLPDEIGRAHV